MAETWEAHGYSHDVHGVYDSRGAAFEALKAMPNMTVYVDAAGEVQGRPRKERDIGRAIGEWSLGGVPSWFPVRWAHAHPMEVEGRQEPVSPELQPGTSGSPGAQPGRRGPGCARATGTGA